MLTSSEKNSERVKMKLFRRLFGKKQQKAYEEELLEPDLAWSEAIHREENIDLYNPEQREKYAKSLVEQMRESSGQLDELMAEYNLVTSYLTDMEELEALPESEFRTMKGNAVRILHLERECEGLHKTGGKMSEEEYHKCQRMEDSMQEGISKLNETEKYRQLIKKDLKKLENERRAYEYRKSELDITNENLRGIGIGGAVTVAIMLAVLLCLQVIARFDVEIGYLVLAAFSAIFLTTIYVKHTDAKKENENVEKSINKLIILQNKVKIRYVNNTNLLDYYYLKYQVGSADDLVAQWNAYTAEKTERERYERTTTELEQNRRELMKQLRKYHLHDPLVWLHQIEALVDHNEMVEIRHNLIGRRQNLRAQIDYNKDVAQRAESKLKNIIEEFPAFAKNILSLIDE